MNPQAPNSRSLHSLVVDVKKNRELLWEISKREIAQRYKGSGLGSAWSFIQPAILAIAYIYVFVYIFQSNWGGVENSDHLISGISIFSGLIIYMTASDVLLKAPGLIINNSTYVKKSVFPLQLLPVSLIATSAYNCGVLIVIVVFVSCFIGVNALSQLYIPIIIIPFLLFLLSTAFLLSALSVFFRDMQQIISLVVNLLLFLSPVFYPVDRLPDYVRWMAYANPLTTIITDFRNAAVFGINPNLTALFVYSTISFVFLAISFAFFQATRRHFADVL